MTLLRAALASHAPDLLREWEQREHAEGRAVSPARTRRRSHASAAEQTRRRATA